MCVCIQQFYEKVILQDIQELLSVSAIFVKNHERAWWVIKLPIKGV